MTAEALLGQLGGQQVAGFFCVLARISPLFVFAPLFSSKLLPVRARGTVAVALAIGMSPLALRQAGQLPLDALGLGAVIAKELLVGLAFAYAVGAVLAALQTAGSLLDMSIGFSFGALLDPISGNQNSVMTQVYGLIGTVVFLAVGGDAWVLRGLARTYDAVGLADFPSVTSLVGGAVAVFTDVFAAALEVAGPVVLALVITDTAFGVVSRVVPQLNVFSVGFAVKVLAGLALVALSMPFVANWIGADVQDRVGDAVRMIRPGG